MGIKKYNPTTPSIRFKTSVDFSGLSKKSAAPGYLIEPLKSSGGRNAYGRMTMRHRGGGHKRMYRVIDFKRDKVNMPGKVLGIEYDPNRSSFIALIEYEDKTKSFILAPEGLKVNDIVIASNDPDTEIKIGNCLPLRHIPSGTPVHNLELTKGKGGQIVRGAGSQAFITAKEGDFAQLKLPSGEIRMVHLYCRATIGQVSNIDHGAISIGKAGRSRWLGRRPNTRGLAMNPHDHPHGGGEGKSGQGNPHPVSKWGMPTKGFKTRKKQKYSDNFIVKRRP
ncbi:MAG: 50S ribosomal protein L2 [Candidatus Omnitrophota bacterium]